MHAVKFSTVAWLMCALLGFSLFVPVQAATPNLFAQHCGACHGTQTDGRIPTAIGISRMNPLAVLAALETGSMQVQAQMLTSEQKRALVEGVTRKKLSELAIPETAYCALENAPLNARSALHWSGWGGDKRGTGYASSNRAGFKPSALQNLEVDWSFGFPGVSQARSQPAIIDDVVYVGGAEGSVSAIDAHSGCMYWRVDTSSAVRGAITVGKITKHDGFVIFAVASNTEVYAIDASTGAILWQRQVGFHAYHSVTGTPAYAEDRLYIPISSIEVGVARMPDHECCVSSGGVVAVNANNGETLWQMRSTLREAAKVGESAGKAIYAPSGAPVWASPTIDLKRQLLYIGTGENYSRPTSLTSDAIMAIRLATGEVAWSQQMTPDDAWHSGCSRMPDYAPCDNPGPDLDFGMSPILVTNPEGQDVLLAGQKSAVVFALNPDDEGSIIWQTRVGKGSALGGIHWGMATDGQRVYVPNADRAAIIKDVNPGTKLAPGMYALDIRDGKVIWNVPTPGPSCQPDPGLGVQEQRALLRGCITANSAAPTVIDGAVFAGDLEGKMRAYDTATGKVLWVFDTAKEYTAANGIPANGGSIDGPGPVIINGRLYVNSGYGSFGQRAGNVLISFKQGQQGENE